MTHEGKLPTRNKFNKRIAPIAIAAAGLGIAACDPVPSVSVSWNHKMKSNADYVPLNALRPVHKASLHNKASHLGKHLKEFAIIPGKKDQAETFRVNHGNHILGMVYIDTDGPDKHKKGHHDQAKKDSNKTDRVGILLSEGQPDSNTIAATKVKWIPGNGKVLRVWQGVPLEIGSRTGETEEIIDGHTGKFDYKVDVAVEPMFHEAHKGEQNPVGHVVVIYQYEGPRQSQTPASLGSG